VALDGLVYVAGGAPEGGLWIYEPVSDSWKALTPPVSQREHVAAVAYEGEVWLMGGRWQGEMFATTEVYEPQSDTWRAGPTLHEARSGFGAAVHNGSIVVAGGEVFDPDAALSSVEVLTQEEWAPGPELPQGIHGNPLAVIGETLYLPGGSTRAGAVDNPGMLWALPPEG
jgi:N-acetylneuraminic acid mutarotase